MGLKSIGQYLKNFVLREVKPFPKPLPLWRLLGPSFLVIATGIGSGEIILWPFLASEYGLGLAWIALVGITFQYFMNMEIGRYTLVTGETVFMGIGRWLPYATHWFIFSTFVGFAIPGTAAASAQIFANIFGFEEFRWLAIGILLLIGLILSGSKSVYNNLELLTKLVIAILLPGIFIFLLVVTQSSDWLDLAGGLVGRGDGYNWIPGGIALATLFGAFAYSGTGGNLNLSQSTYVKEEGYGMGKYTPQLAGLFSKDKTQKIRLEGYDFELNETNLKRFRQWWRRMSIEHLIVFWGVGLLALLFLMMLAAVVDGAATEGEGIYFILNQAQFMATEFGAAIGATFLVAMGLLLFQSQMGIYDAASRIIAENYAIDKVRRTDDSHINLSRIYYTFLWGQIIIGIILFALGFYDPVSLVTLAALINAVSMGVNIALVNYTNWRFLPREVHPARWRKGVMILILLVFVAFSVVSVAETIL